MLNIKKSLHKFVDDFLTDVFVSYDSNFSDIKSVNGVYSESDLSLGTEFVLIDKHGVYETDFDFTNWYVDLDGDKTKIIEWDGDTSTIKLENPITLTTSDKLSIDVGSWIFMNRIDDMIEYGSTYAFRREIDRWDLIIKTKNDSNKDKIDTISYNLKNEIILKKGNIPIYKLDLDNEIDPDTKIGYMKINLKTIDITPIGDKNNDIQIKLFTFTVKYDIDGRK